MTIGYGHCKHGHIMVFLSSSHSVLICRHCSLFARWLAVIHFCKTPLLQFWLFKFCILMDVRFFSRDENSSLYFDILLIISDFEEQKGNATISVNVFPLLSNSVSEKHTQEYMRQLHLVDYYLTKIIVANFRFTLTDFFVLSLSLSAVMLTNINICSQEYMCCTTDYPNGKRTNKIFLRSEARQTERNRCE